MPEKISAETRSRMMSGIRGRNTKPELLIRKHLHADGFRFRLHRKDLAGRPDVVLQRWNAIVFAHGCFWHGHENCQFFRVPKTRTEFWSEKIRRNAERDAQAIHDLRCAGWRVSVVWECALRADAEGALQQLSAFLRGPNPFTEIADVDGQARAS
jgi:DNA mismatch endonuclease (patch repair protein)